MTLVCGIDFSEASRDASRVAAAIARKRGEALVLVHSAPLPASGQERLHAALEGEAAALRDPELPVSTELCFGWPDEDVERVAEAANASLIVLGAVGHRRGTHWIVGSMPERTAQRTRRPLLVVRDRSPLEAWARGAASLTCVVGTDLAASSRRVIDAANQLSALGRTRIILEYVIYHPGEYARLDLTGPIYHRRLHPVVEEVVTRGLEEQERMITGAESVNSRYRMTLGEAAEPLLSAALEGGAGLIIVGAHQRHGLNRIWHGSVAHNVLHGARTSVLVIPLHGADPGDAPALQPPPVTMVLAATDFSPEGDRALAWAGAVTPASSRLCLVTVISQEDERPAATEQLRGRAEAMNREGTICEVVTSKDVAASIAATGERIGASLLCVGASGGGGTAHPFFGSVARALLTRSRVPVLAVRET